MSTRYPDYLKDLGYQAGLASMSSWRGLRVGMIPCYREKERHANWRWGQKKGLRRARRRLGREMVRDGVEEAREDHREL